MSTNKYDVFISHASEDKDAVARVLAEELRDYGVEVWYDEFSLEVGDSLTQKINDGLANANYGIVILSKFFLNKGWTQYELEGLVNREVGSGKVILPIWHEITKQDLLAYSPTLAGKVAIETSRVPMREMVLKFLKVIRPDIFNNLLRLQAYKNLIKKSKWGVMEASKLKSGPVRHATLSDNLINRIQLIHSVFADVANESLERTINNFQRDVNPEREVAIWERMSGVFLTFIRRRTFTVDEKKEIFGIILSLSFGTGAEKKHSLNKISTEYVKQLRQIYYDLPSIPENKPEWDKE